MYPSIFSDELFLDAKLVLPILKKWGMTHVDFRGMVNGKPIEEQTDEELKTLKAQLDELGMKTAVIQSSLCKVHLPDKQGLTKEEKKLEGLIRACEILDCKLVRAFFYWQPYGEHKELQGQLSVRPDLMASVTERFAPILKRAREAGLVFGFENCGVTWKEVLSFLGAVNVPGWGLAWDPYNDYSQDTDMTTDEIIQCIQKSVMLHVKAGSMVDGIKTADVPWPRILRGMLASGKDIPVSVETHNPKGSPYTPEEASRLTYAGIRNAWPAGAPASLEDAVKETKEDIYPPCPFADNPVRFVVVGLGMGRGRARQIVENPSSKLLGVCDINLEKAREVGEELCVPYSNDINVFLQNPDVEVMYIVTPTGLHCSIADQCLEAGKHVLMTKPMDANVEACDKTIELATKKGLQLGIDFDLRQSVEMVELVDAVRKGWFGRLLYANLTLYIQRDQKYYDENGAWRGTWRYDGGGAMSNQGIHEIDFMQEVLGIPDKVRAGIATQAHVIETEDLGWSEWQYDQGYVARFAATTSYPVPSWNLRFEIHGTGGAYINTSGGPEGHHIWWVKASEGSWKEKAPYPSKFEYRCGSDRFAAIIRRGLPNVISGDIGRKSRLILDALYKSAKAGGEWVRIGK